MKLNKGYILHVKADDDALCLQRHLEDYGYQVMTANTYAEALVQTHCTEFDLFLLDGCFDHGASIQMCLDLLKSHPEIPVALWGEAIDEDAMAGRLDASAVTYLTKPLSIANLVREIEEILVRAQK